MKDVKPTRSELIELKKKIALSQRGHKLLKMKRDGLIIEFFNILRKARETRSQIVSDLTVAKEKLGIAEAVEGRITINSVGFAMTDNPLVKVGAKNVMGVVVPTVEAGTVRKRVDQRGYGIIGTSIRIDETAKSYEILVEHIIKAAEIETTLRKLLDDIEKVKRRVNALEFRVIPELKEAEAFIRLRLDELERENTFRLKRIKKAG